MNEFVFCMCMLHDTPAKFSEKDFLGICNLDADLPNEFVTIVLKLLETHRSIHISCDHFQEPWDGGTCPTDRVQQATDHLEDELDWLGAAPRLCKVCQLSGRVFNKQSPLQAQLSRNSCTRSGGPAA